MVSGRVPEEQVRLRAAPRSISPPHPDPNAIDRLAEMLEGHPERVDLADEIRPALERALAADRPASVHVRIDSKATRLSGGVYLR